MANPAYQMRQQVVNPAPRTTPVRYAEYENPDTSMKLVSSQPYYVEEQYLQYPTIETTTWPSQRIEMYFREPSSLKMLGNHPGKPPGYPEVEKEDDIQEAGPC